MSLVLNRKYTSFTRLAAVPFQSHTDPVLLLSRNRLVDEITYKKASEAADAATQSAILGPFYLHDTPLREKGSTISFNTPKDAEIVYMHGKVTDAVTGKPLPGSTIQAWEASTNGELQTSPKDDS